MAFINQELLNEFMATSDKLRKLMFQKLSWSAEEKRATMLQLQALHQLAKKFGSTVGDLATEMMLSSGAVAQLTERLVNKGWIERTTDEKDGRIVRLNLSESGKQYLNEHRKMFEKEVTGILKYVTEAELKILIEIQNKMLKSMEERQNDDSPENIPN